MLQAREERQVYYDEVLEIEAYALRGVVQKFPKHFHGYYVLGFIEGGKRRLWCKGKEYELHAGDFILFNPRDNHCCAPVGAEALEYRAINVPIEVMRRAAREIAERAYTPHFIQTVARQSDLAQALGALWRAIVENAPGMEREEAFFFLIEQVLREYAAPFEELEVSRPDGQVQALCKYIEAHFAENITLDALAARTNFGKSYLLRSFTKQVGISPYRYLLTVRLDRAKGLLEEGVVPVEVAQRTGFADQSHFSNFFKECIGLTPKQYQRIFLMAK